LLSTQTKRKTTATELVANKELAFQNEEKRKACSRVICYKKNLNFI
jgi:hypothetical protein